MTTPRRRRFTTTWWGQAWVDSLEQRARLDPNRLPRGRTYARQERVEGLAVAPGLVTARVQGSRSVPYRVRLGVRQLDEGEWDRFLGAVAARAAHAAALLDGELAPAIVEDARQVGVELLPVAGDLRPNCSCPDWADPCKHSAAVCYLVAVELDRDPFVLLELRGRSRRQVLGDLRRRRGAGGSGRPAAAPEPAGAAQGMLARQAWSRTPGPLPQPPPVRSGPGRPAAWPADPPAGAPFTGGGLVALAGDAAVRAWRMARGEGRAGLDLGADADLARRAAELAGTAGWGRLVEGSGIDPRELQRRGEAWRIAGTAGLAALTEPRWRPEPAVMIEARARLVEAGASAGRIRIDRNAVVVGDVQIRIDRTGRWWPFRKVSNRWELAGPPADDPDEAWSGGATDGGGSTNPPGRLDGAHR